jgi:biotin carboxyl carrier protein
MARWERGFLSLKVQEYFVTWNEKKYAVVQTGPATYSVNGVEHIVDFAGSENMFSAIIDNDVFSVEELRYGSAGNENSPDIICLSVDGIEHRVTVDDERSLLRKSMNRHDDPGQSEINICSPMPGLVVKMEVNVGDSVSREQGLVVLEAMKMENELRAPQKGTIASVYVERGDTVEKGEKLLTLRTE